MQDSTDYMGLALVLARKAFGRTSPNPAVGAVLVRDGAVVGQGYTQPPGSWHAEVMALGQAGEMARGATLYVTLEPCCHFGRTPPCTRSIIDAGVQEVRMALLDPNPRVDGRGKATLEEAGIEVRVGERQDEAAGLNEAFIKHVTTGLPLVIVKFASSLDGKIATRSGDSKWITGEAARGRVHEVRDTVDAVMVGVRTLLADNPQLTARLEARPEGRPERQPLRVIVDSQGRTPPEALVLQCPGCTIIATTAAIEPDRAKALKEAGAELLYLPERNGMVDLAALLKVMGKREVTSVLVEGGGALIASLLEGNLVDKVMAFIAPVLIGGRDAPTAMEGQGIATMAHAIRLRRSRVEVLGEDVLITGYSGFCAADEADKPGLAGRAN
ncbi:MAG: bifunctional diaminohydroxyphosphoribosylaminopyrimidine deaminase/5-amino-6-(5-phosphoribosylamino)uracil reductase RibD [Dehalococcoidia bacterium]|nr:bifunctional diaminohydroxyphosphoribosylaminopyrimidine deaminase/5-amino-6-(5-phosphoribosylamino)uracil reductase RibD [Dehalococcoidia bacterium]